jgi:hypothetical protein
MRQRLDRIIMFCDIENKISSLFHEYLANGDNRDDMLSQSVSKLSPSDAINMLTVFNILRNKMYKMWFLIDGVTNRKGSEMGWYWETIIWTILEKQWTSWSNLVNSL